ncbi:hypothetical protein ACHAXR_012948 [Thalassiosira sp. AJA248-18]
MMQYLILLVALIATASDAYTPVRKASSAVALFARKDGGAQAQLPSDRRTALARIAAMTTSLTINQPAYSADQSQNILEARSSENSLLPPLGSQWSPEKFYGMEATDIFYPPGFQGIWKAYSKTAEINAPCGFELFTGGKAAYDNAVQTEINEGNDLQYKARFITQSGGGEPGGTYVIADREYNAREIAKAAMGEYSVVDTSAATPNRYSCLLAPPGGSNSLICVDIITLARKYEPISSDKFVCSEFVRQIVSPAQRNNPNAPPVSPLSVKEIETISIYNMVGKDQISCRQRTATFLVPSQTDPIAYKKWQLSQGKPVDVRYYDVTYTRVV